MCTCGYTECTGIYIEALYNVHAHIHALCVCTCMHSLGVE